MRTRILTALAAAALAAAPAATATAQLPDHSRLQCPLATEKWIQPGLEKRPTAPLPLVGDGAATAAVSQFYFSVDMMPTDSIRGISLYYTGGSAYELPLDIYLDNYDNGYSRPGAVAAGKLSQVTVTLPPYAGWVTLELPLPRGGFDAGMVMTIARQRSEPQIGQFLCHDAGPSTPLPTFAAWGAAADPAAMLGAAPADGNPQESTLVPLAIFHVARHLTDDIAVELATHPLAGGTTISFQTSKLGYAPGIHYISALLEGENTYGRFGASEASISLSLQPFQKQVQAFRCIDQPLVAGERFQLKLRLRHSGTTNDEEYDEYDDDNANNLVEIRIADVYQVPFTEDLEWPAGGQTPALLYGGMTHSQQSTPSRGPRSGYGYALATDGGALAMQANIDTENDGDLHDIALWARHDGDAGTRARIEVYHSPWPDPSRMTPNKLVATFDIGPDYAQHRQLFQGTGSAFVVLVARSDDPQVRISIDDIALAAHQGELPSAFTFLDMTRPKERHQGPADAIELRLRKNDNRYVTSIDYERQSPLGEMEAATHYISDPDGWLAGQERTVRLTETLPLPCDGTTSWVTVSTCNRQYTKEIASLPYNTLPAAYSLDGDPLADLWEVVNPRGLDHLSLWTAATQVDGRSGIDGALMRYDFAADDWLLAPAPTDRLILATPWHQLPQGEGQANVRVTLDVDRSRNTAQTLGVYYQLRGDDQWLPLAAELDLGAAAGHNAAASTWSLATAVGQLPAGAVFRLGFQSAGTITEESAQLAVDNIRVEQVGAAAFELSHLSLDTREQRPYNMGQLEGTTHTLTFQQGFLRQPNQPAWASKDYKCYFALRNTGADSIRTDDYAFALTGIAGVEGFLHPASATIAPGQAALLEIDLPDNSSTYNTTGQAAISLAAFPMPDGNPATSDTVATVAGNINFYSPLPLPYRQSFDTPGIATLRDSLRQSRWGDGLWVARDGMVTTLWPGTGENDEGTSSELQLPLLDTFEHQDPGDPGEPSQLHIAIRTRGWSQNQGPTVMLEVCASTNGDYDAPFESTTSFPLAWEWEWCTFEVPNTNQLLLRLRASSSLTLNAEVQIDEIIVSHKHANMGALTNLRLDRDPVMGFIPYPIVEVVRFNGYGEPTPPESYVRFYNLTASGSMIVSRPELQVHDTYAAVTYQSRGSHPQIDHATRGYAAALVINGITVDSISLPVTPTEPLPTPYDEDFGPQHNPYWDMPAPGQEPVGQAFWTRRELDPGAPAAHAIQLTDPTANLQQRTWDPTERATRTPYILPSEEVSVVAVEFDMLSAGPDANFRMEVIDPHNYCDVTHPVTVQGGWHHYTALLHVFPSELFTVRFIDKVDEGGVGVAIANLSIHTYTGDIALVSATVEQPALYPESQPTAAVRLRVSPDHPLPATVQVNRDGKSNLATIQLPLGCRDTLVSVPLDTILGPGSHDIRLELQASDLDTDTGNNAATCAVTVRSVPTAPWIESFEQFDNWGGLWDGAIHRDWQVVESGTAGGYPVTPATGAKMLRAPEPDLTTGHPTTYALTLPEINLGHNTAAYTLTFKYLAPDLNELNNQIQIVALDSENGNTVGQQTIGQPAAGWTQAMVTMTDFAGTSSRPQITITRTGSTPETGPLFIDDIAIEPGNLAPATIEINNRDDLYTLCQSINAGRNYTHSDGITYATANGGVGITVKITNHIDVWWWDPMGTEEHPFRGRFDGQGFTLRRIEVTGGGRYSGFFGVVESAPGYEDLYPAVVENTLFSGTVHNAHTSGGICGRLTNATISSCVSTMTVTHDSNSPDTDAAVLAGLCGQNEGLIEYCINMGLVAMEKRGSSGHVYGLAGGPGQAAYCISAGQLWQGDGCQATMHATVDPAAPQTGLHHDTRTIGIDYDPNGPAIAGDALLEPGHGPGFTRDKWTFLPARDDKPNRYPVPGADDSIYAAYSGTYPGMRPALQHSSYSWGYLPLDFGPDVADFKGDNIHVEGGSAYMVLTPLRAVDIGESTISLTAQGILRFSINDYDDESVREFRVRVTNPDLNPLTGDGEPIDIATAEDLAQLAAGVNSGAPFKWGDREVPAGGDATLFRQTADIDLSGHASWTPIGDKQRRFQGHYDGQGHTISNMSIEMTGADNDAGLFGVIEEWGKVGNVRLDNVSITAQSRGASVAGTSYGTILNCEANGTIAATRLENSWPALGGIAGKLYGRVEGCLFAGTLTGAYTWAVGGIAGGLFDGASVERCQASGSYTQGDPSDPASHLGGIVGYAQEASQGVISDCAFYGHLEGPRCTGGILGSADQGVTLRRCVAAATFGASRMGCGNIAGPDTDHTIDDCHYDTQMNPHGRTATADDTQGGKETWLLARADFGQQGDWSAWSLADGRYPHVRFAGPATNSNALLATAPIFLPQGQTANGVTLAFSLGAPANAAASWSTADTLLATLHPNGAVEPLGAGTATLSLTLPDGDTRRLVKALRLTLAEPQTATSTENGTAAQPYLIYNAADLAALATGVNSGLDFVWHGSPTSVPAAAEGAYFALANDIDLSDAGTMTPIGAFDFPFRGTFDGQRYMLRNPTIGAVAREDIDGAPAATLAGLFGRVWLATIKNFSVAGATVDQPTATHAAIVAAVASNGATIDAVIATGTVRASDPQAMAGGVAGLLTSSSITNCMSGALLTGADGGQATLGGLAGAAEGASYIANSGFYGSLGNAGTAGGIAASVVGDESETPLIIECLSAGVMGNAAMSGAIVGTATAADGATSIPMEGSISGCRYDTQMSGALASGNSDLPPASALGAGTVRMVWQNTSSGHATLAGGAWTFGERDELYPYPTAAPDTTLAKAMAAPMILTAGQHPNHVTHGFLLIEAGGAAQWRTIEGWIDMQGLGSAIPYSYGPDTLSATDRRGRVAKLLPIGIEAAVDSYRDGSAESPLLLHDDADLRRLAARVNNGAPFGWHDGTITIPANAAGVYFDLAGDVITLDTTELFTPIGVNVHGLAEPPRFDGHLEIIPRDNMAEVTIRGLRISDPDGLYGSAGLIGELGVVATVADLSVQGARVRAAGMAGIVAGVNNGTIRRCSAEGEIEALAAAGATTAAGAIAGYNHGRIDQSASAGVIRAGDGVIAGGIAGGSRYTDPSKVGEITLCQSATAVWAASGAEPQALGGIVGEAYHFAVISNCAVFSSIAGGGNTNMGGIAGQAPIGGAHFDTCLVAGTLPPTNNGRTGAILGFSTSNVASARNCVYDIQMTSYAVDNDTEQPYPPLGTGQEYFMATNVEGLPTYWLTSGRNPKGLLPDDKWEYYSQFYVRPKGVGSERRWSASSIPLRIGGGQSNAGVAGPIAGTNPNNELVWSSRNTAAVDFHPSGGSSHVRSDQPDSAIVTLTYDGVAARHLQLRTKPHTTGTPERGTPEEPFLLRDEADLATLSNLVNNVYSFNWRGSAETIPIGGAGKVFALANDIVLSDLPDTDTTRHGGYPWMSIGRTSNNPFKGTFDGRGHAIDGLRQYWEDGEPSSGLFGCVDGSHIHDLALTDVFIDGGGGPLTAVLLAGGALESTIERVAVEGTARNTNHNVAGLVSNTYGTTMRDILVAAYIEGPGGGPIANSFNPNNQLANCVMIGQADMPSNYTSSNFDYTASNLYYDNQVTRAGDRADDGWAGRHQEHITSLPTREMLGDALAKTGLAESWSFAPGRYPVPATLAHRADVIAMATPLLLAPTDHANDIFYPMTLGQAADGQAATWDNGKSGALQRDSDTTAHYAIAAADDDPNDILSVSVAMGDNEFRREFRVRRSGPKAPTALYNPTYPYGLPFDQGTAIRFTEPDSTPIAGQADYELWDADHADAAPMPADTVLPMGQHDIKLAFQPSDPRFTTLGQNITVSVGLPVLEIEAPAVTVVYGQTLAQATIAGGRGYYMVGDSAVTVPGHFGLDFPDTRPDAAGDHTTGLTFYPDDDQTFKPLAIQAAVAVLPLPLAVELDGLEHIYDAVAKEASVLGVVPAADPVTGLDIDPWQALELGYALADGTPLQGRPVDAGDYQVTVSSLQPNYSVDTTAAMAVLRRTPELSAPEGLAATYGQMLADIPVEGGRAYFVRLPGGKPDTVEVEGAFVIDAGGQQATSAGTTQATVEFQPADGANFNPAQTQAEINVARLVVDIEPTDLHHTRRHNVTRCAGATLTPDTDPVTGDPLLPLVTFAYTGGGLADSPDCPVDAGEYQVAISITGNENIEGQATATLVIGKATPRAGDGLVAQAITYGQSVGQSRIDGWLVDDFGDNVSGEAHFTQPDATPPAGVYNAPARFAPADTANYATVDITVGVPVNKYSVTISNQADNMPEYDGQPKPIVPACDVAADLVTGQPLALLYEVAYAGRGGTPYDTTDQAPAEPGDYTALVAVSDANYQGGGEFEMSILKIDPRITWPAAGPVTYGQPQGEATLEGGLATSRRGDTLPGDFLFLRPDTLLPAGLHMASVAFAPDDTAHVRSDRRADSVAQSVAPYPARITLSDLAHRYDGQPKAPTVAAEPALDLVTGQPVDYQWQLTYSGNGLVDSPEAPTEVGEYTVTATITATPNYQGQATGTLAITPSAPTVEWPTASAITYGQSLAMSSLEGGRAYFAMGADTTLVPGSFAFDNPDERPAQAGAHTAQVTFAPADTLQADPARGSVDVPVAKYTAQFRFSDLTRKYDGTPKPVGVVITPRADVVTGQPLALEHTVTYQADGYGPTPQAPTEIGDYEVQVSISDASYQGEASAMLIISDKAIPEVQWPTASAITYGDSVGRATLSGGAAAYDGLPVPGSYSLLSPELRPDAGTWIAVARFDPSNLLAYSIVVGAIEIPVQAAQPAMEPWPQAATTYGHTLAQATLAGGVARGVDNAIVPGQYQFADSDSVPGVGQHTFALTFAPHSPNYAPVTGAAQVTVGRHTPRLAGLPAPALLVHGHPAGSIDLSGAAALGAQGDTVAGTLSISAPDTLYDAGRHAAAALFRPADTLRYTDAPARLTVQVLQARPEIEWPAVADITYGQRPRQALAGGRATHLGREVEGEFDLAIDGQPVAGDHAARLTFRPASANYAPDTAQAPLRVLPFAARPAIRDTIRTYDGQPKAVSVAVYPQVDPLTGRPVAIPARVTYTGIDGTEYPESEQAPSAEGEYLARATVEHPNFAGQATARLRVVRVREVALRLPDAIVGAYGQRLYELDLSRCAAFSADADSLPVAGAFAFASGGIMPGVGLRGYQLTFTPADRLRYRPVSAQAAVRISPATPAVQWPATAGITYGQRLSEAPLAGGSAQGVGGVALYGDFTFAQPDARPDAGVYRMAMAFTPNNGNYAGVATSQAEQVEVRVAKFAASVSIGRTTQTWNGQPREVVVDIAPAADVVTGQPISIHHRVAYQGVDGTQYGPTAAAPTAQGRYLVTVTVDAPNYQGQATDTLEVNGRTTPEIEWPTASGISYGERLAASELAGGRAYVAQGADTTEVAGAFAFELPNLPPPAGVFHAAVVFAPADAAAYNTARATVPVAVAPAAPTVQWPEAGAIVYGQSLANAPLTGGAAFGAGNMILSGAFAFADPGHKPGAGAASHAVTFVPANTNYAAVTSQGDDMTPVAVSRHPAQIEITDLDQTADGTPRHATVTILPATDPATGLPADIARTVTYQGVAGTTYPEAAAAPVLAGDYLVRVQVTDPNFQGAATDTLRLTDKPALDIEWPTTAGIGYGQTVGQAQFQGGQASHQGEAVPGIFELVNPNYAPDAGVWNAMARFTPADLASYNRAFGIIAVPVAQATPVIGQRPQATHITYGQPLAASALAGGAVTGLDGEPLAGTWAFAQPDSVANAGVGLFAATFAPASANYTAVTTGPTALVPVWISKAASHAEWPSPDAMTYGTPLGDSQLNATADIDGHFSYTPAAGAVLPAGAHTLRATFTPADTANYLGSEIETQIIVEKALAQISWPAPADIVYGTPLGASQLNATAGIDGHFSYTPAAGTVLDAGAHTLNAVFTPADTANYHGGETATQIIVEKALAQISWPTPADIVYGTPLGAGQLNATAGIDGQFTYAPAAGAVLDAGTHTLTATFAPADTANYHGGQATAALAVGKAQLVVSARDTAMVQGDPLPDFALDYQGLVAGDTPADLDTAPVATTQATSASPAGQYVIEVWGGADGNYAFEYHGATLTVTAAVGVDAARPAAGLSLYPNPALDALTLARPAAGPALVEIFSVDGAVALTLRTEDRAVAVDIADLAPGAYLARVTDAAGALTARFVKR